MRVTTTTVGRETRVTLEETNGVFGSGVWSTSTVNLTGSTFANASFEGFTIAEIKENFILSHQGDNLLSRSQTTLSSDGVIDFGFAFSGTAYLTQLKDV